MGRVLLWFDMTLAAMSILLAAIVFFIQEFSFGIRAKSNRPMRKYMARGVSHRPHNALFESSTPHLEKDKGVKKDAHLRKLHCEIRSAFCK